MEITVDAKVDLDNVLDNLSDSEIVELLDKFSDDDLVYELESRNALDITLLKKFTDEDLVYEVSCRDCSDKLVEILEEDGVLDEFKSTPPEHNGLTTNLEKEKLHRYLCDVLDLGYHTDVSTITNLLNTKLNERL